MTMPDLKEKLVGLIDEKQIWGIDQEQPRKHDVMLLENEELAYHLIANGVTIQKWIPASELPKTDDYVLVWFEYFRYGSYNRLYRTIGIGSTFRGEWSGFVNGGSGWQDLKILAWMPLPEPPVEVK